MFRELLSLPIEGAWEGNCEPHMKLIISLQLYLIWLLSSCQQGPGGAGVASFHESTLAEAYNYIFTSLGSSSVALAKATMKSWQSAVVLPRYWS